MKKNNLKRNFIIGSANFSKIYGADAIKVNKDELKKIFSLAKKKNIYEIETAKSYLGKSSIFKSIDKKFKILTKIIPNSNWISLEFSQKKIEDHLKIFKQNSFEAISFHDTKILFTEYGKKIFYNLEELKKKKYFREIGLSIYDTENLDYLISNYNFDIIQFPFNILDRRIVSSGWLKKLKNKGIKTHARSIFLQGLLVNELIYNKNYFKKWKKYFSQWFQDLKNNNISPIDYCLSDLMNYDFEKVIIGINSTKNFNEIINFKTVDTCKIIIPKINERNLVDPRCWK